MTKKKIGVELGPTELDRVYAKYSLEVTLWLDKSRVIYLTRFVQTGRQVDFHCPSIALSSLVEMLQAGRAKCRVGSDIPGQHVILEKPYPKYGVIWQLQGILT